MEPSEPVDTMGGHHAMDHDIQYLRTYVFGAASDAGNAAKPRGHLRPGTRQIQRHDELPANSNGRHQLHLRHTYFACQQQHDLGRLDAQRSECLRTAVRGAATRHR